MSIISSLVFILVLGVLFLLILLIFFLPPQIEGSHQNDLWFNRRKYGFGYRGARSAKVGVCVLKIYQARQKNYTELTRADFIQSLTYFWSVQRIMCKCMPSPVYLIRLCFSFDCSKSGAHKVFAVIHKATKGAKKMIRVRLTPCTILP